MSIEKKKRRREPLVTQIGRFITEIADSADELQTELDELAAEIDRMALFKNPPTSEQLREWADRISNHAKLASELFVRIEADTTPRRKRDRERSPIFVYRPPVKIIDVH